MHKVLIVHNRYKQPGGEDSVVAAESELLRKNGHDVTVLTVQNEDVVSVGAKLRAAFEAPYSVTMRRRLERVLTGKQPDIVHVHNTFPLISPSVYDACAAARTPVVQTLHNYRLLCPAGTMLRDGAPCEQCTRGLPLAAVRYGCYRSRAESAVAVATIGLHRLRGTWRRKVSCYIALTDFARQKFVESGLPANRIFVKPNFTPCVSLPHTHRRPEGLFVGRLSEEKGIRTLAEAARQVSWPIRVIGDGPLKGELLRMAPPNLKLEGWLAPTEVFRAMEEAAFLLMPSEWYEGLPMVLLEAFARGLPAVVSRIGGLPEIVQDEITGVLVEPRQPHALAAAIERLMSNPEALADMGRRARADHAERFSAEANYQLLREVYGHAMAECRN